MGHITIVISINKATVYRWVHKLFTKAAVNVQKYKKHKALVTASAPREVVEHDTVDLGGEVYAYTAIDIFSEEPCIYIGDNLEMVTATLPCTSQLAVVNPKRFSDKPWKL